MDGTRLDGTCTEQFKDLEQAIEANLRSGEEFGLSMVVNIDGHDVVDMWGGHHDAERTAPWTRDTIVNVWSCSKLVTNLAALMLVDRGMLDVHAPVARYWPEFAAAGKEAVEVRHVMGHTSGVSGWDTPFTVEEMCDWQPAAQRLAAQAPWWEPGTASGYHAGNQGHLIGELVRRITGKPLKEFVATEIAGPLGADFQIGAQEADWPRVTDVVPPPPLPIDIEALDKGGAAYKTFMGPTYPADAANTAAWRRADMGGCNGHGNAASVARILSAVTLGGEVDGFRLLSPETLELVFEEQADGVDLVLGLPLRWGMGFGLPQPEAVPSIPREDRICFWGGYGGSMVVMDLGRRMTISYVMNKMAPGIIGSARSNEYISAVYAAVD